jgi:hypothetical protein
MQNNKFALSLSLSLSQIVFERSQASFSHETKVCFLFV